MSECHRCGTLLPDEAATSVQPMECPTCGYRVPLQQTWETGFDVIRNYFKDVWKILIHPVLFFKHMPIHGGLGRPLAFALVTHWIGTAVSFIWGMAFGDSLIQGLRNLFPTRDRVSIWDSADQFGQFTDKLYDRIYEWYLGVGPVLADPFLTLFSILVSSFFIFIGARILISPGKKGHRSEVTYESIVRIVSFGLTPSVLATVPLLGKFVAPFWTLVVTVIGTKEVFRIGSIRALIVVLFPKLVFLGIVFFGIALFILTIFKFLISF